MKITEVFDEIMKLHTRLGLPPLNKFKDGWRIFLEGEIVMVVNGNSNPLFVSFPNAMEIDVPPYMAAFYNKGGWIIGLVSPSGGASIGYDSENEIINALKQTKVISTLRSEV